MEIEIKLTGLDDLASAISDLAKALTAGVKADQVIDVAKASSKKKAAPAAPVAFVLDPALAAAVVAGEPAVEPAPIVAPMLAVEPVVGIEQAKTLVLELTKIKGRPVAASVLEKFGAARLGDVAEDKLPELVAALNAALAA